MPRVKRGVQARARHKKVLKQAKGYYGARSRVYRVAFQAVTKAGQYADFTPSFWSLGHAIGAERRSVERINYNGRCFRRYGKHAGGIPGRDRRYQIQN